MKRILTKVEAGLMKNNNATNTQYLPIIKPAKTIDYQMKFCIKKKVGLMKIVSCESRNWIDKNNTNDI